MNKRELNWRYRETRFPQRRKGAKKQGKALRLPAFASLRLCGNYSLFGKKILAATLRGSASQQVMTAGLNELSTYGLLKDMRNEELELYLDALIKAGCLKVKGGAYPTVSSTELGDRVMREQERVELALP